MVKSEYSLSRGWTLVFDLVAIVFFSVISAILERIPPQVNTELTPFSDLSLIGQKYYKDSIPYYAVWILTFGYFNGCLVHYLWNNKNEFFRGDGALFKRIGQLIRYFFLGITIAWMITNGTKIIASRMRPRFLAACLGNDRLNITFDYTKINDRSLCVRTNLDSELRSFPSGHTSLAFSSATITFLYFYRFYKFNYFIANLIPTVAVMGAFFISASRYVNNAHHIDDIVVGAIIGIVSSWFSSQYDITKSIDEVVEVEDAQTSKRRLKF